MSALDMIICFCGLVFTGAAICRLSYITGYDSAVDACRDELDQKIAGIDNDQLRDQCKKVFGSKSIL